MNAWETFQHEADVGIRGTGDTLAEAFAQAAIALTAAITEPSRVRCREWVEIHCEAPEQEVLLLDWINAMVYEMATRKLLFSEFTVNIDGARLEASACGEPMDRERHAPAVEVKGATFTELRVMRLADGRWLAQCVVDV